jgi:protease-4
MVALGLLVFSLLALVIGVVNTATRANEDASGNLGGDAHLSLIDLSGMITMDSARDSGILPSESNAMQAKKSLDEAAKDDDIKGVLLHINSPGGTVAMSQELNAAVKRVIAKGKPVVVSMGDLTASGGYYTACAADKIVANPGTLTASIGVIISSIEFSDLLHNKLGVAPVTIKSGKFKDILSPYRKPRPDELSLLQTLINNSYHDFLTTVIEDRTRNLTSDAEKKTRAEKIKAIADGRVVTGRQALAAGLVDEIGDEDRAYTLLDSMAKLHFHIKSKKRLPLVSEEKNVGLLGLLSGLLGSNSQAGLTEAMQMIPMSMRYRNQPLWMME